MQISTNPIKITLTDYIQNIHNQACNSSFHEKLESFQCNAYGAITGVILLEHHQKNLYQELGSEFLSILELGLEYISI